MTVAPAPELTERASGHAHAVHLLDMLLWPTPVALCRAELPRGQTGEDICSECWRIWFAIYGHTLR